MSTSIIYHLFGAKQSDFLGFSTEKESLVFRIESKREQLKCKVCGSRNVISKGRIKRKLRAFLNARSQKVFLAVSVRKIECKDCGVRCQEDIDIADGEKVHYTKQFRRTIEDLLEFATVQDVARFCDLSWATVKNIDKARLKRKPKQWSYRNLRCLAVDEIYIGKSKKYRTIVIDLETGAVVYIGVGRGIGAVSRFLTKVKRLSPNIAAIAMDMSGAYHSAVTDLLPSVDIIFDRFHIMKLMNKQIDELRRAEQRRLEKKEKKVLKGKRFLLLRNADNLTDEQRISLKELLSANEALFIAYVLKEDLRGLWDCDSQDDAEDYLDAWIIRAVDSGIIELRKMAGTMNRYRIGVLNYFKHELCVEYGNARRITTATLEGFNNKIRTMTRKSYGLRDDEYLNLKIMNL